MQRNATCQNLDKYWCVYIINMTYYFVDENMFLLILHHQCN